MSSVITTGSFPLDLVAEATKWVGVSYNGVEPLYDKIFTMRPSTGSREEFAMVRGLGLPDAKGEGEDITYDSAQQEYVKTVPYTVYAKGIIITREAMEDGKSSILAEVKGKMLGRSMAKGKETVAAQVLNRAFDSNYTGADGVSLCSTSHPSVAGSQSNTLATQADLSEASLEQMVINIKGALDQRGLKINLMPKTLVVPNELPFEATRILASTLRPATSDNDVNALKELNMLQDPVIVNPYLTDTDAFYIVTDADDGLVHCLRRAMESGTDNVFDSENLKIKATERYLFSWADWRGLFASQGA